MYLPPNIIIMTPCNLIYLCILPSLRGCIAPIMISPVFSTDSMSNLSYFQNLLLASPLLMTAMAS